MVAPLAEIVKVYPKRGPLQQFRFAEQVTFSCFRCGQNKKSKLLTVFRQNWEHIICNGCYGWLLSVYDVQKGTADDDVKADGLAQLLLSVASASQIQEAKERLLISTSRTRLLSPEAMKFLATSDYVAYYLGERPALDWCPAIIGLCKACEREFHHRVFEPLRVAAMSTDLTPDRKDNRLRQVALYCSGMQTNPPELGAIWHFLSAMVDNNALGKSPLLEEFRKLLLGWPKSRWLLSERGALASLEQLRTQFRNKAAHSDELGKIQYDECFSLVVGTDGLLWSLISSTQSQKGLRLDK